MASARCQAHASVEAGPAKCGGTWQGPSFPPWLEVETMPTNCLSLSLLGSGLPSAPVGALGFDVEGAVEAHVGHGHLAVVAAAHVVRA